MPEMCCRCTRHKKTRHLPRSDPNRQQLTKELELKPLTLAKISGSIILSPMQNNIVMSRFRNLFPLTRNKKPHRATRHVVMPPSWFAREKSHCWGRFTASLHIGEVSVPRLPAPAADEFC